MNQYLSEIVVVLITSIFSIVSIIVQKKQDRVVESINKQVMFSDRERELKKKMDSISMERESIIHSMMVLIMDTNLELMKSMETAKDLSFHEEIYKSASKLKCDFDKTNEKMEALNKEYDLVKEMASEAQKEIDEIRKKK